ncbi:DUF2953 domain-containing protein [Melghirimyces algeriensis]|uniref:DUF2953 domain-containing protein n=1 Tax=Melghirimyces algeriensis TaxID=910412 RepID=UPI00163D5150|nr:DUF2953 domain-containing protein [Melghirimyces algeriensis]
MIWKLLLGAILIILMIFPLTSVRIQVRYWRKEEKDHLEVYVRLFWGLIRFKSTLPSFRLDQTGVSFWREQDTRQVSDAKKKGRISLKNIKQFRAKLSRIRRQIASFNHITLEVSRRFLRHVVCERLRWDTSVGTGDAASTGVLTGVIWGVKTSLVGFAGSYIRWACPPRLNVQPLFNNDKVETTLDSIIRFRIGYAIVAVIRLLIRFVRNNKGGEEGWQSTQFKA